MKVAIAGAGKVGAFIARHLRDGGHTVDLYEQDPDVIDRLQPDNSDITFHLGDTCEVSFLEQAGLRNADVLVAATGDDEDNLVASLLAKQEFAVPRVVARVNHPDNEWLFNETWGVDVSVSAPHLLTAIVEEALSVGSLVRLLQLRDREARLVEVTLAPDAPAAGYSLSQIQLPRDATIVAILRDRHVVVPRGDTVLQPGDEVIALVMTEAEDALRAHLVRD